MLCQKGLSCQANQLLFKGNFCSNHPKKHLSKRSKWPTKPDVKKCDEGSLWSSVRIPMESVQKWG